MPVPASGIIKKSPHTVNGKTTDIKFLIMGNSSKVGFPNLYLDEVKKRDAKIAHDKAVAKAKKLRQAQIAREKTAARAKAAQRARQAVKRVYNAPASSGAISGCGDNSYAHFIYMKESGCNVNAVNSIGCRGIGQACPGTKLPCGADYACQNRYFTAYAMGRYGSWKAAYNFWLARHWW